MAIIQNDDESLNNQPQQTLTSQSGQGGVGTQIQPNSQGGGGALISGSSTPGGAPNTSGVSNSDNPTSSGLFTNLQSYLNNSSDTSGLQNNVNNFFNKTAGSARDTLGSNVNDFDTQVKSGTVNYDENLANQASSDPTSFVQNAQNLGSFQHMVNGTYAGPNDFATSQQYSNAQQPIQTYDQYVQQLSQPNQYNNLLSTIYQGQSYTPGELALDSSLLANNSDILTGINNNVKGLGSLDQDLANANTQEQAAIQKALETTSNTNKQATGVVNTGESNLQNSVNQNVTAAQNKAQQQFTDLQKALDAYTGYTTGKVPTINLGVPFSNQTQTVPYPQGNTNPTTVAGIANPLNANNPNFIGTPGVAANTPAQGITADQLKQLGVSQDQWDALLKNVNTWNTQYGTPSSSTYGAFGPLSGYLTSAGTAGINANTVATPADYAKLNAYQTLLGPTAQPNTFLTNPAQAGTAPTSLGSFDYQNALSTVQSDIDSASAVAASKPGASTVNVKGTSNPIGTIAQVVGAVASVAAACSDRRLKYSIKLDGFENGHQMYTFKYKWNPFKRYRGVMAQDVLKSNPKAVTKKFGFYAVYYGLLGVKMSEVK